MKRALAFLALTGAACSSGGGGGPTTHQPLPQVIDLGGPVAKAPVVVPVLYAGDADAAAITTFVQQLGSSAYWSGAVGAYGVGAMTARVPASPQPAPGATLTDQDFRQVVSAAFAQDPTAFDWAQTVFVFFPPASAEVMAPLGGSTVTLCGQDAGYHSFVPLDATHQGLYAVVARCSSFLKLTGVDVVTGAASHELAEAVTDPLGNDVEAQGTTGANPAYGLPDDVGWSWLGGGEIGDLCANLPGAFFKDATLGATVQHIWSNAAAAGGHDPCGLENPYFNAAPRLPDTLTLTGYGHTFTSPVVKIAVGSQATVDIDLFSDGPTAGPWTIEAVDMGYVLTMTQNLQLSLDRATGQNGDVAHLTIQVQSRGQIGGIDGLEGAVIISKTADHGAYWPLLVQSP